jgi:uncharacterized protein
MPVPDDVIAWTERLHAVVDEVAAPIAHRHGARLRCRAGCNDCCSDGLTVFPIEAALIARHHADLLATASPHADGACAFLDEDGSCRIYAHRPYVCRTQGLPLRWLERDEDDSPIEARDICPLNLEGGPDLEELAADECWTLGPFEKRLAERQAAIDGGTPSERVPLRSLFPSEKKRRLPVV